MESIDRPGRLELVGIKLLGEVNKRLVEFVVGLDVLSDGAVVSEFADVARDDGVLPKVDLGLDEFARFGVLLLSAFVLFLAGSGWGSLDLAGRIGVSWNWVGLLRVTTRRSVGARSPKTRRALDGSGNGPSDLAGVLVEILVVEGWKGVGHVGKFADHTLATSPSVGSSSTGHVTTLGGGARECVGSS